MSGQVYKAVYSNVRVYEFMCNDIAVMKRQSDSYLNATQILKVAEFDKVQRTRILEREIQTGQHEKVQGGYGKYQGTWVPFERGVALAQYYHVDQLLRPILDYVRGDQSPPIAPKHLPRLTKREPPPLLPKRPLKKRLVGDNIPSNNHTYAQYLLQYFMANNQTQIPNILVDTPSDLDVNMVIDEEGHTCLHWAAALGRADLVNLLSNLGADTSCVNYTGQTALMRSVLFAKSFETRSFPAILFALKNTISHFDKNNQTVFHHASSISGQKGKIYASRFYIHCLLDNIEHPRILNMKDVNGETALSMAKNKELINLLITAGASPMNEHDVSTRSKCVADNLAIEKGQQRLFSILAGMYERDYTHKTQLLKDKRNELQDAKRQLALAKRATQPIHCDLSKLREAEQAVLEQSKVLRRQLVSIQKENINQLITKYSQGHTDIQQPDDLVRDLRERRRANTERLIQLKLRPDSKKQQQYKHIIAKCSNIPYEKVDSILQPLLSLLEQ